MNGLVGFDPFQATIKSTCFPKKGSFLIVKKCFSSFSLFSAKPLNNYEPKL